jgi:hypothetical protein
MLPYGVASSRSVRGVSVRNAPEDDDDEELQALDLDPR